MRDFIKRVFSSVFNGAEQDNTDNHSSDGESNQQDNQLSRASRNLPHHSQLKHNNSDSESSNSSDFQRKRNSKRTTKHKKKDKLYSRHTRNPIESESEQSEQSKELKLIEETKEDYNHLKSTVEKTMGQVDSLYCSICMEFIINCRTAICGHSFCQECINESLIRKKECPICRKDIRKWVQSKSEMIDKAVKMMVDSKSAQGVEDEKEKYLQRVQNAKNWLKKHTVVNARPGQKVDVLDTEHIWCTAEVEIKILAEDRKPLLYLHYDGWSRKYDEYLYTDSSRVAPKGVYTSRNDIPRYRMCQHQPNMMYANVIDSARAREAAAPVNPDPASSEEEGDQNENAEDEAALAVEGLEENGDQDEDLLPDDNLDDSQQPEQENFINDNHVQQIQEEMMMEELGNLQQSDPVNYGHIELESAFAQGLPASSQAVLDGISNSLFSTQHRDSIRANGMPRAPLNAAPVSDENRVNPSPANEQAEELQVEEGQERLQNQLEIEEQQPTVAGTNNIITDDYFTASNAQRRDASSDNNDAQK